MAEMQSHLYSRQDELQRLKSSDTKNKEALQTRLEQSISGSTLELYNRFFQSVSSRSSFQARIISESGEKVEAKRMELVKAMKQRRVLEILKDREILKRQRKALKDEITLIDEVAATRWQMRNS